MPVATTEAAPRPVLGDDKVVRMARGAWNLLPRDARDAFRDAVDADEATWERGRGWALSVALVQLPYYRDANPRSRRTPGT